MSLEGKKILVTGGSGFIGTNLIQKLKGLKADILNVDLKKPKYDVKTEILDLTNTKFPFLDKEFDYVIHLAALTNHRMCSDNEKAFDTNVTATFKFFNKLVDKKVKKIVFMSSIVVYSDEAEVPIKEETKLNIYHNNYSYTKGIDEQICEQFRKKHNMPILTFRLSNIYGPHQEWKNFPNLLPQIISQALLENKIEVWNPKPVRDWIYVDDVVNAIIKGLESSYVGVLNLGTGKGSSVKKVVETVADLTGAEVKYLNKEVSGPMKVICDISKIKKELGFKPKTKLEEGLKKTVEYYKKEIKGESI